MQETTKTALFLLGQIVTTLSALIALGKAGTEQTPSAKGPRRTTSEKIWANKCDVSRPRETIDSVPPGDLSRFGAQKRSFQPKSTWREKRPDWLAVEAVLCELFSTSNSLLTGKNTGNFAVLQHKLCRKGQRIRKLAAKLNVLRQIETGNDRGRNRGCRFPHTQRVQERG
jgi:hypothetical protein